MSQLVCNDNDTIFHYCSADAFLNIFRTGKIWLSRCDFMNDSLECKMLDSALKKFLEQRALQEENEEFVGYSKAWLGGTLVLEEHAKPFIACFSRCHDTLSQWRGYGAGGYGFAVGYSISEIKRKIEEINNEYDEKNKNSARFLKLFAEDVKYTEKENPDLHDERMRGHFSELFSTNILSDFMFQVRRDQAFLKSDSFHEEFEYRIVAVTDAIKSLSGLSELKFRTSTNGAIIPYYELVMPAPCRIVIGPKNPLGSEQLNYMLWRIEEKRAVDCEESKVTYI